MFKSLPVQSYMYFLHATWSIRWSEVRSKHSPGAWSWSLKHWRLKNCNCKCSMANGEACMTYFSLTYSLQSLTLLLTHYTNGTPVLWSLMHWCSVICNLCMVHNNVSDHLILILILILIQIQSGTGSKSSEYRVTEHRVSQSTELVTEYWGLVTDGWWL